MKITPEKVKNMSSEERGTVLDILTALYHKVTDKQLALEIKKDAFDFIDAMYLAGV